MKSKWDDLDQLRHNIERALEDVYRRYQQPFLNRLRWKWPRIKTADHEDIFQDTVIITWENVVSGRLKKLSSTLWNYMWGIGYILAQTFWRKHGTTQYFDDMTVYILELDPNIEQEELTEERLARIWAEIDRMPEPNRSILTLTYKYGMSSAEIAEVMNYDSENSANVVAVQRKRAMDQLNKTLDTQKITSS